MPVKFTREMVRFKTDSYGLSSHDSEPWQSSAACGGADIKLFTLGMTKAKKDGSSRKVLLETIDKYCYECPVMFECERDADPIDRQFLVRGGLLPTLGDGEGLKVRTARPSVFSPVPSAEQIAGSQIFQRGECQGKIRHKIDKPEDLVVRSGGIRCRACIRMMDKRDSDRQAARKAACDMLDS